MSRSLTPAETLRQHLALSAERCAELAEAAMAAGNQKDYKRYLGRYRDFGRALFKLRDPEGFARAETERVRREREREVAAAFPELRAVPLPAPPLPELPFEEAA